MTAKILVVFFIIALVLLSGCADGDDSDEPGGALCLPEWRCKDASTKAYQNIDCSWERETVCGDGCLNGACINEEDSCEPGWYCKDENTKAYQEANCSSRDDFFCTNGCIDGECIQDEECETGWKCKDGDTAAYQTLDCSWSLETACEEGCSNGECNDAPVNPCEGIECDDFCLGNTRRSGGSCTNGSCLHSETEACEFGCVDGTCNPEPCADPDCEDYCDGDMLYEADCVDDECSHSPTNCALGCYGAECIGGGLIFVTSEPWEGGTGLPFADAFCRDSASAAGLAGWWVSLTSDQVNSVANMPGLYGGIYRTIDGAIVANSKADLLDGTIDSPVNVTELGTTVTGNGFVWTGTKSDGTPSGQHCSDFSTESNAEVGTIGSAFASDARWIEYVPESCDNDYRLYCALIGKEYTFDECAPGWACRDLNTAAYQMLDCGWTMETACEEGCVDGACVEPEPDACEGGCADYCLGTSRRYDGSCVNDSCLHASTEICSFGCVNGTCNPDPCEGMACDSYCDGRALHSDGICTGGVCNYTETICESGCENAACTGEGNLFVTSGKWLSGSGASSADVFCANSAAGAGLEGNWVAIMSNTNNAAADMVGFPDAVFKKLDGTIVASDKADLFDGTIESPIDLTEIGTRLSGQDYVWTGTDTDGGSAVANCVDWISSNPTKGGMVGNAAQTNWRWIAWGSNVCDDDTLHLYCVKLD